MLIDDIYDMYLSKLQEYNLEEYGNDIYESIAVKYSKFINRLSNVFENEIDIITDSENHVIYLIGMVMW